LEFLVYLTFCNIKIQELPNTARHNKETNRETGRMKKIETKERRRTKRKINKIYFIGLFSCSFLSLFVSFFFLLSPFLLFHILFSFLSSYFNKRKVN